MSEVYKAPEAQLHASAENSNDYGSLESALAGNYELQPIKLIKDAWGSLKGFMGIFWLAFIIYLVISSIVSAVTGLFVTPIEQQIILQQATDPEASIASLFTPWAITGWAASQLLLMFITTPLTAGLYMIAIKHSVGAPIRAEQVVKYFDKAVPLFLTTVLMYVFIVIGLVLFVLPGVYLMVAFMFALPLVVEKDMSPMEALSTSRKAVHHKWFNFLGLGFVAIVVIIIGMIALLIGLVWAIPVVSLAYALAYRDIFGVEAKTAIEN